MENKAQEKMNGVEKNKALSIKQPWAQLIIAGVKDIENRTWRTHFRGTIYIHASASPVPMNGMDNGFKPTMDQLKQIFKLHPTRDGRWPDVMASYINSAILGTVEIIDCVQNHPSVWAEKGAWHWVLANPVKYNEPILNVKGSLSFWTYDPPTPQLPVL